MNNSSSTHRLFSLILSGLQQHPQGLTEYQLISWLREQQHQVFVQADLQEPLSLFQTHFFLFHHLYRLRDALHAEQVGTLDIHTLSIRLHPWAAGTAGLCQQDPLRAYYLDLAHLANTDRAAVEALLNQSHARLHQQDTVRDALDTLGFNDPHEPPNAGQIRRQYRRQVSRHHPDRGGSTQQLQALNHAYDTLKQQGYLSTRC